MQYIYYKITVRGQIVWVPFGTRCLILSCNSLDFLWFPAAGAVQKIDSTLVLLLRGTGNSVLKKSFESQHFLALIHAHVWWYTTTDEANGKSSTFTIKLQYQTDCGQIVWLPCAGTKLWVHFFRKSKSGFRNPKTDFPVFFWGGGGGGQI